MDLILHFYHVFVLSAFYEDKNLLLELFSPKVEQ